MANPVIVEICERHQVSLDDFFSRKRNPKLWECRKEAALAFREKGLSWPAIARILKRDLHTLKYWFNEKTRARRARYNARREIEKAKWKFWKQNGLKAMESAFHV